MNRIWLRRDLYRPQFEEGFSPRVPHRAVLASTGGPTLHQPQVKVKGSAPAWGCDAGAVVFWDLGGRGDKPVEFADPVLRCFG